MEIKNKLDTAMNTLAVLLISLFALNPIIQFVYVQFNYDWYPLREKYNYIVLSIGLIAFIVYLYKRSQSGNPVGFFKLIKNHPALLFFMLFAFWMVLTTIINDGKNILQYGSQCESLTGNSYRNEGLYTYLSYLVYFLFALLITSEKLKSIWLKVFGIVSSFVAILIVIDYFFPTLQLHTIRAGEEYNWGYAKTFFNNPNHTAYYMLVSVLVCAILFVKAKKIYEYFLYGILTIVGSMALIIDDTLGCIVAYLLASLMAILILSLTEKRFSFKSLTPLALFLLAYAILQWISPAIKALLQPNLQSVSDMGKGIYSLITEGALEEEIISEKAGTGRVKLWKITTELIAERPIVGYSADAKASTLTALAGNQRCHNEYMHYALSFGIPATIFYVAGVFTIYLRGLKNKAKLTETQKLALIVGFGYCVSAFFGNTMFYTAPLLFIMLGFGYYRTNKN